MRSSQDIVLCSRTYVDTIIQPGKEENEFQALIDMVDRSNIKEKTIILADRGYESYNIKGGLHHTRDICTTHHV